MPRLHELARFLAGYLDVDRYGDDPNGVWVDRDAGVRRLGLALEPGSGLGEWLREHGADALLLHRPWGLEEAGLPAATGVLAYHLAFDERLTVGENPRLAAALGLADPEPLGRKEGRVIGMIGRLRPQPFERLLATVEREFGGIDQALEPREPEVDCLAAVGAMTADLVREAAAKGAGVYLTGQIRQPARDALFETGLGAIAVGHRRSEVWGLHSLAALLRERWPDLETAVWTGDSREAAPC